ncbi:hypothetical protein [Uliginosibacterium sp. H1]|uniref:hypothetical protein n=1 Tax=Uliginosibacterium sp. H1 TaxID=3114757 RepID=UPI002E196DBD|nr:hypothetical protein [Uliginosibacterium sp. H1]
MSRQAAHPLDAHRGPLRTRVGAAFPGTRAVFRGHDLHRDLADASWLDLYVFGLLGRRLERPQLELLSSMWATTSYPDTRLWNNRVAALAASTRSSGTLGLSAALAVSEASIYGRQIDLRAMDFLQRALRASSQADSDQARDEKLLECIRSELAQRRKIAGFGRPINGHDERIAPLRARAQALGLHDGPFCRLVQHIERLLLAHRYRLRMNYAALTASLCADMGLDVRQYYLCSFPAFLAGMLPCYLEALEKPAHAVMPQRVEDVQYTGVAPRSWPSD